MVPYGAQLMRRLGIQATSGKSLKDTAFVNTLFHILYKVQYYCS